MRTGRPQEVLPDVVFAGERSPAALSDAVRRGRMVRIGPGIYSTLPRARQEDVVRRNVVQILDHALPGAIIADRSAYRRTNRDDALYVIHSRTRPLELPGLTVFPRKGFDPLPGDTRLNTTLWTASEERTLLESLAAKPTDRYLTRKEIEDWIDAIIRNAGDRGEQRINVVRDRARELSEKTALQRAFGQLDAIIGAALSTRPVDTIESAALRARATGKPFDQRRLVLFEAMVAQLRDVAPAPIPLLAEDEARRRLLPFYEAYFSNYIEGTEFTLDEAAEIVFDEVVPPARPADAHDILGTYQLVSDQLEKARTPQDPDDLIELLKARHRVLMEGRPDMRPGEFKTRNNQAGSTMFVAPDLVEATMREGFSIALPLVDPFARALYMMFLTSEVHPFVDGNGRIARVMMNAELTAEQQARIIVPTVYRNNYISALKAASHNQTFSALVSAMRFVQRWTAQIDFSTRQTAEADLVKTNALRDANEAEDVGIRLTLPTASRA